MKTGKKILYSLFLSVFTAGLLAGCESAEKDDRVTIEFIHYKKEATEIMEELAADFELQNPDIHVIVSAPNDAGTIIKTRLVKNDVPDIIAIGGDRMFADFVEADVIENISDFEGLDKVQEVYLQMTKDLELIPKEGIYGVPFVANANGVLYNKDMFEEHGWKTPETWSEFIALSEEIKAEGITPITFTLKEAWTDLAAWNSIDACINSPDLFQQVNKGETTFSEAYSLTADKLQQLLQYGQKDIFAYGYNDGCTDFGRGESAMFLQGSWAIPQILSTNPDMNISSFAMPGTDDKDSNILNSGIDLLFAVMEGTPHKEECLRFIDFMLEHEASMKYADNQKAIPCIKGSFTYTEPLQELTPYFQQGRVQDFPDHHYPAEMPAGDMIQGFLMNGKKQEFLQKFDKEWVKTNRDIIAKLRRMEEQSEKKEGDSDEK